jgi:hypothetical protein
MMATNPAARRYIRRFVPTMIAYVVALFGAQYLINSQHPTGALLVALAILPALPIIGVIAVIGLYVVEESDEYLRRRAVSGMLVGLALMLGLATAWGFLEEAGVVPHLPAYWAFVIWCAAWGLAQCLMGLRDRLAGASA